MFVPQPRSKTTGKYTKETEDSCTYENEIQDLKVDDSILLVFISSIFVNRDFCIWFV